MKSIALLPMLLLPVFAGLRAQTEAGIRQARQDPQTMRRAAEADVRLIDLRQVTDSTLIALPPAGIRPGKQPACRRLHKKS